LANTDNPPPRVFGSDGLRGYPGAIRELRKEGRLHHRFRQRTCDIVITGSSSTIAPSRALACDAGATHDGDGVGDPGDRGQVIRKGQVLGITRQNLYGQAWVFGALLQADPENFRFMTKQSLPAEAATHPSCPNQSHVE
jgi:hypothetical protein